MGLHTEQDFKDFAEDQGFKWDDGFGLDCLVHFNHDGKTIVSPWSYTLGNPVDIFGVELMSAWKKEAASLMSEWAADA